MKKYQSTTLSRQELHQRIWATPLAQLAEEFGTARGNLTTLCAEHDIPCPGRGFWTAKKQGRVVKVIPLPDATLSPSASVTIDAPNGLPSWVLIRRAIEEARTQGTLPVVAVDIQRSQLAGKTAPKDLIQRSERARAIFTAMKSFLEKRGYTVGFEGIYGYIYLDAWVRIQGERVKFGICEIANKDERHAEKAEPKKRGRAIRGRAGDAATASKQTLSLSITAGYSIGGRSWRDADDGIVEERLGEVVIAMEVVAGLAAEITSENAKSEYEWQQRRAEKRRRARRLEELEARWTRLASAAADWRSANNVRRYLVYLANTVADNPRLARRARIWTEWAEKYMRVLDPLLYDPEEAFRRLARPRPPKYSEEDEYDMY